MECDTFPPVQPPSTILPNTQPRQATDIKHSDISTSLSSGHHPSATPTDPGSNVAASPPPTSGDHHHHSSISAVVKKTSQTLPTTVVDSCQESQAAPVENSAVVEEETEPSLRPDKGAVPTAAGRVVPTAAVRVVPTAAAKDNSLLHNGCLSEPAECPVQESRGGRGRRSSSPAVILLGKYLACSLSVPPYIFRQCSGSGIRCLFDPLDPDPG